MSNQVAVSFASLVKNNNGFFKSEKQAAFLLSHCQESNTFITGGEVYGNRFSLFYNCDDKGVVTVEKHLPQKGQTEVVFQRHIEGVVNEVEAKAMAKEIKRLTREIKALEKSIAARDAAFINGDYAGMESLYIDSKASDESMLEEFKAKLAAIQS